VFSPSNITIRHASTAFYVLHHLLIFSHDDAERGGKIPVGCGRPSIKLLRLSMESSDEEKEIFVSKDRWRCRDEIEEGVKDVAGRAAR